MSRQRVPAPAGPKLVPLTEKYPELLPKRRRVVVLLADDRSHPPLVRAYVREFKRRTPTVVVPTSTSSLGVPRRASKAVADSPEEQHEVLSRLGPVDLVVDVRGAAAASREETWRRLHHHLRDKGAWVIDRRLDPARLSYVEHILQLQAGAPGKRGAEDPETRDLLACTSRVVLEPEIMVAAKRLRTFLKLTDDNANELAPLRNPELRLREITALPAQTFRHRGRVISHESAVDIRGLSDRLDPPTMHLRHYRGPVAMASNQLVYAPYTILPDAFRQHLVDFPTNAALRNESVHFARIRPRFQPTRTLAGTYYLLDSENSGHYGHLMTDVVSRMWGWDVAKQRIPDLKAIFRIRYPGERVPVLEQRVFAAFGIQPEDIVWTDEPVWLESAVGASTMWHNQPRQYVHPRMAEIWRRIGAGLGEGEIETSERLFVSRTGDLRYRNCRNIRDVEALFESLGFRVIFPERFDLADQARLFRHARVVAGLGGSGLFNTLFSQNLETLVVLNAEGYTARNEHLVSAVLGCDTHYFWSTPDTPHPAGGWTWDGYRSDWEFDFARNQEALVKLLT